MTSITEKKYVALRKKLDQLGYRQALGLESLPLVSYCTFSFLCQVEVNLQLANVVV